MKEFFLGNLATKGMAVLLAFVTWAYLYAQGNGPITIMVSFDDKGVDIPDLVEGGFFLEGKPLKHKDLVKT